MADPQPSQPQDQPAAAPPAQPVAGSPSAESMAVEALRNAQQAVAELRQVQGPTGAPGPAPAANAGGPAPVELPVFATGAAGSRSGPIDLLGDVNLNVKIELGRTRMLVEDVLRLGEGSVVELDKLAGDPVDVYVNDRHVARGEVLVLNDNFCVRVNEIIKHNSPLTP